ncbi:Phospholipid-translocating ATPase [Handroanthus impetiginosus]|uniref:Phospholipid-translocating ATPase n=1 Tax=Handroanthus impetiginosus TaxID=429701 RepID=A0A2G9G3C1_9LAMI|nr:Phospholipid-translocating ATPase [Handroanthus impetiginosus]
MNCDVVICCRVSPKQKASITRMVKEHSGKTILAIGDGANDVGMIQEADIGVGISGMEGMQAVMASDFSLPQFRFLERLLIVHGHWCYRRISKMILYFVYKNVTLGLTLFYYNIFTGFSGQDLYDDWYMTMFNVLLTSLPVLSVGVLEQDVSSDVCLKFPALYQQGQRNICFGWKRIIGWILNGILTSLTIFLLNIYALSPSAITKHGYTADMEHIGTITYTSIIWTVNCQVALMISHFTFISHILIWGSIICWYIFLYTYDILPPTYPKIVFHVFTEQIGPEPAYWIVTLIVVIVSLLPYFIHIVIQRSFFPMDDHIIQEMKYSGTDVSDGPMWLREQERSKQMTQVGYSARVDAKIRHLQEQMHRKRKSFYSS